MEASHKYYVNLFASLWSLPTDCTALTYPVTPSSQSRVTSDCSDVADQDRPQRPRRVAVSASEPKPLVAAVAANGTSPAEQSIPVSERRQIWPHHWSSLLHLRKRATSIAISNINDDNWQCRKQYAQGPKKVKLIHESTAVSLTKEVSWMKKILHGKSSPTLLLYCPTAFYHCARSAATLAPPADALYVTCIQFLTRPITRAPSMA